VSAASVELWVTPLAEPLTARAAAACAEVLSPTERAAAARFRQAARRDQALTARVLLRLVLSRRLGGLPGDWRFETEPQGRPRLAGGAGPDFNLAHADGCVVLAIADAGRVGVDVEPLARAPEIRQVAGRVLAPAEIEAVHALDTAARDRRLVQLWTLKEAWTKARGAGLGIDFRTVAFAADAGGFRLPAAPGYAFETFEVAPAHVVSVACEARAARIERRDGRALLFG